MSVNNKRIFSVLSRYSVTKFFLILPVAVLLTVTSCDKSSVVGLDVQPSNDLLNVAYQDTTTLITRTIKVDSIRTDEDFIVGGIGLIGKYIDPVFGPATASLYTQVRLSTNISATSFGSNPVCDSVVLAFAYDANYYGKNDRKQQTANVYQLSEDIKASNQYYSNSTLTKSSLDLTNGGYSFIPHPLDSVTVIGIKQKPQLRIPLDVNFGQLLLNNQTTGNLSNNTAFQTFMKGLYITTENTSGLANEEGNILSFKLGDAQTKLTVYYHDGANDSLKYDFSLGSVARFTHFTHDYSTADASVITQLSTNPPTQNNTLFIQSMGGLKAKIEMPYLMNWSSSAIGINKAEVVLKVDQNTLYQLDTFAAAPNLILGGINDDGSVYDLPDASEGSNYYSGVYNSTTKEYHFNIARYIQQVLTGAKKNNGLYVIVPPLRANVNAHRVVIGGGSSSSGYQMKLNITYTKLR
jgi:hypothetical protein